MKVFYLTLFLGVHMVSAACDGGGYSQLFPLAQNENQELWVLKMNLSRNGPNRGFGYKTELRLYNNEFHLLDTVALNKGVRMISDYKNFFPMRQMEWLADSLYSDAVSELSRRYKNLQFLNILGVSQIGIDSFADVRLSKKRVITQMIDTNYRTEGLQTRNYIDTADHYYTLEIADKKYEIESLKRVFSDSTEGDFLGLEWTRINNKGVKYYEVNNVRYLVLHFDLMFGLEKGYLGYRIHDRIADKWFSQMYQPIGWHHNGQEILFKLE